MDTTSNNKTEYITSLQLTELALSLWESRRLFTFPLDEDCRPMLHSKFSKHGRTASAVKENFEGTDYPCSMLGILSGPDSGLTAMEFLTGIDPFQPYKFLEMYGLRPRDVPMAESNLGPG